MKKLLCTVAAVLLLTATAACGGDNKSADASKSSTPSEQTTTSASASDYCAELRHAKQQLKDLDFANISERAYQRMQDEFARLQAAAPADVKDDWTTLTNGVDAFRRILEDAGLSIDDLQGMTSGQVPPSVKPQALAKLRDQLNQFNSTQKEKLQRATESISKRAKALCKLDIGN